MVIFVKSMADILVNWLFLGGILYICVDWDIALPLYVTSSSSGKNVSLYQHGSLSSQCAVHFLYVDLSLLMLGFGATATGTGLFGQQQQQQSTGTSLFGNTAFGAAKPMFGAAATTASAPFGGLSTAGAGTTLFGQANQNKVSRVFCPRGK